MAGSTFYIDDSFEELAPQALLERLEKEGIQVTQQTLRNWERNGLISKPARGARYGGRWTVYSEYVLPECYAAYMLLSEKSIPKFPIPLLAKARELNYYHPEGFPLKPAKSAEINTKFGIVKITDEYINPLIVKWTDAPQIEIDNLYKRFMEFKGENNYDTLLDFHLLVSAQLLWFKFFYEGASKFWIHKQNK